MITSRYEIRDGITNQLLGTFDDFEMAIAFIYGFKEKFYNEPLSLVIIEIRKEFGNE